MSENNENNENNHKKDNFPSFIKPSKKSCPTRYLFVSKANTTDPNLATLLTETFSQFGDLDTSLGPTCINLKRHVCYVIFKDVESCERALLATQTDGGIALQGYEDVRLICKYAGIEKPVIPPPEPECISSTANVNVPGLTVIENFVTEDEEQYLLDFCDTRNAVKYFSKGIYINRLCISAYVEASGKYIYCLMSCLFCFFLYRWKKGTQEERWILGEYNQSTCATFWISI